MTDKSFSAFLRACPGKGLQPGEARTRLLAANIKSLSALLRWTRERYPDEYKNYSFFRDCTGRELCSRMWADYLRWKDQHHARV